LTICGDGRRCIFGQLENTCITLSLLGRLVRECWVAIPEHFGRVQLDEFVVMPNHLHGILVLHPIVGAQQCCALLDVATKTARVTPASVSAIVRSFKAIVTRRAHEELFWSGQVWQRNYFERIVRDGKELADIRRYIAENAKRWEWDRENRATRVCGGGGV
jgi:REP element-mobilizing transposase RayT